MINGIDYYAGDGSPNLSGYAFAFIKATEGIRFTDPAFQRERARVRAAGLVFGAYHFGHPEQDVDAEVAHFLRVASPAPGDVLFLDFEDENGNFSRLSNAHLTAWKNAWLARVKARCPNNQVGLYCNVDVWRHRISDSNAGDFLFIAQYGGSSPAIHDPWLIWQYGTGQVDYDKARFDSPAAMRAWAHQEDKDMTPEQDARLRRIEELVAPGGALSNELVHGDNPQPGGPRVAGNDQILVAVQQLIARTDRLQQEVTALSAGRVAADGAGGNGSAGGGPAAGGASFGAANVGAGGGEPAQADPSSLAQALGPLLAEQDAEQVKESLGRHVGRQFAEAFTAATRVLRGHHDDPPPR